MKKLILIALFISCVPDDMSVLTTIQTTEPASAGVVFFNNDNRFTNIREVTNESGTFYNMYVGTAKAGDVVWDFYRKNIGGHDYYGGIIYAKPSYDDGKTWGSEIQVYDPDHLLNDNGTDPVLSQAERYDFRSQQEVDDYVTTPAGQDKTTLVDARDTRAIVTTDGTHIVVGCFVALGFNDGTTRVKVANNRCMAIKIPLNSDNSLALGSKTVTIVEGTTSAFSGGLLPLPNNDVLYITYHSGENVSARFIKLFKSSDNGETYGNHYATAFLDQESGGTDREAATEVAACIVNNELVVIGRPTKQTDPPGFNNIIGKSPYDAVNDQWGTSGTWTYEDSEAIRSNGPGCAVMPDGLVAVFGRFTPAIYLIDPATMTLVSGSELDWPTSGYGTIIPIGVLDSGHHIFLVSYYRTDIVEVVQLVYNPATKRLEFEL